MNIPELIGIYVGGGLIALGITAGGIGFLISQFKDGRNKQGTDNLNKDDTLLNYLRNENAIYKGIVNDQTIQISDLKAANKVLAKKVSDLEALVSGRDPSTKQFQDFMVKSVHDREVYQETATKILDAIVGRLEILSAGQTDAAELAARPTDMHIEGVIKS